ncbi:hypothetical protein U9M48_024795 [Paspalum notatum var. saurae]|uniref:Uncharacterized protein n=1 Tax=Paspalum notatum var. saurae TaxID=547442 RepID=A0AAQ3WWC5_PASNO
MAQSTVREHYSAQAPARRSTTGAGKAAASPEKTLNCFVRSVALVERAGNALGTLAFTWATVVLLGGYPTQLRPNRDFWFATTIVFLEAARYVSTQALKAVFFGKGCLAATTDWITKYSSILEVRLDISAGRD